MPSPEDRHTDARSDDRRRLTELFVRHADGIYTYAAQRVSPEDARDVVSEVFLVAWRRLDAVRSGQERPWLFGIARRLLLAHRRRLADAAALQERLQQSGPPVEVDLADGVVDRTRAMRALSLLSDGDRDALVLAYWCDLSAADAARAMGCTRVTFGVRLHRARSRLAAALSAGTTTPVSASHGSADPASRSVR